MVALGAYRWPGSGRWRELEAQERLDFELLADAEDVLVLADRQSLPGLLLEVEDPAALGASTGHGEDPRSVLAGLIASSTSKRRD